MNVAAVSRRSRRPPCAGERPRARLRVAARTVRHPQPCMPPPAIALRGVHKRFGEIVAVDGLDLDVAPGTCLGLLGPNGAGKSTTMRMLTAQSIADEGEIDVLGHRLPGES